MGTDVIPLKRNWSKLSLLLFIANTYINLKSLATLSMDVASSAFLSLVVALTAAFFSLELVFIHIVKVRYTKNLKKNSVNYFSWCK